MAKSPTSELFTTLKGYFNQLTDGERTPTEVASALNDWARDSAESVKAKIAEEVEATVSKMGFVKRDEYEKLEARVAKLEAKPAKKVTTTTAKSTVKKSPTKKIVKKSVAKKASK
jgi:BMFP domain-containing protein YqiC